MSIWADLPQNKKILNGQILWADNNLDIDLIVHYISDFTIWADVCP